VSATVDDALERLLEAKRTGGDVTLAVAADGTAAILITLPRTSDAHALIDLVAAAHHAATSPRVLREAMRKGELAGFGGQRDRSVRREDLERWIEARRLSPVAGVDDDDIDRRVRRLASAKGAA
jgi:hypothetical protein